MVIQASIHGNSVQGPLLHVPASSISHGVGVLGITLSLYFPHKYAEYVRVFSVPRCLTQVLMSEPFPISLEEPFHPCIIFLLQEGGCSLGGMRSGMGALIFGDYTAFCSLQLQCWPPASYTNPGPF